MILVKISKRINKNVLREAVSRVESRGGRSACLWVLLHLCVPLSNTCSSACITFPQESHTMELKKTGSFKKYLFLFIYLAMLGLSCSTWYLWSLLQYVGTFRYNIVLVVQLCPILCDSLDCSPPGSSVHGILQAGILEWVPSPGDLPNPRVESRSPALHHVEI